MNTKQKIVTFLADLSAAERYDDAKGYHYWETPDGRIQSGICTNGAELVARRFGGAVFGYKMNLAEHEGKVAAWALGHDFAVIANRYLVDWWGANVEGSSDPIYDLHDPTDLATVESLYLPRACWIAQPKPNP